MKEIAVYESVTKLLNWKRVTGYNKSMINKAFNLYRFLFIAEN